jgi:hypothetical protein
VVPRISREGFTNFITFTLTRLCCFVFKFWAYFKQGNVANHDNNIQYYYYYYYYHRYLKDLGEIEGEVSGWIHLPLDGGPTACSSEHGNESGFSKEGTFLGRLAGHSLPNSEAPSCRCSFVTITIIIIILIKLALTSPTSGGRSVGIVRSRTQTTEFFIIIITHTLWISLNSIAYVFISSFHSCWLRN